MFSERKTQAEHSDINHSNTFFNLSSKVKKIKAKIGKWDLIKLKNFLRAKETIKKQSTEWEKIFADDITEKRLISKIYQQLIQLTSKNK